MKNHQNEFTVAAMCRFLNSSRSCFYAWLKRPKTQREKQNEVLTDQLKILFKDGRGNYGTRRLKRKLANRGHTISRRRIGRLMTRAGLICKTKRKFKVTTDSKHHQPLSPNLLERQFNVEKPDQTFVGDITYIETQEGWLYLAVVIDLYSRQVVGWSMDKRMKAKLVNDALLMAIWKRKPAQGLIWHTDRGSQYASDSHRAILKQHRIEQSMSRKGNCWDNAVSESFFHTLKTELVHHCNFKTREEAKHEIFEYIEVFYNRIRLHSANDYLSPVDYENRQESM
jgi:transposase InsO family protein